MSRFQQDRWRGCLLGLAVGDAVGTAVEFQPRGSFKPLTDMVGGGPFRLLPGQWTDDTSMALCLAASLLERGGFDAEDQMRRYLRWAREGYLSSNGRCFDIGNTVSAALQRFHLDGNPYAGPTDPGSAGNGCIMRLAPIPMFFFPDPDMIERHAADSSRTTHGATESIDACRLFGRMIGRALAGTSKDEILLGDADSFVGSERITAIARGHYRKKPESEIRGSGYVVHSLEAALWAFARTDSFESAVLAGANLGDDADTTAAVCGQIAGAHYGVLNIPDRWLDLLAMRAEITKLADDINLRHRSEARMVESGKARGPVEADAWETQPMPAASKPLPFEAEYTAEEFAAMALGHRPEDMDDKWRIAARDMTVAFYRSWSGFCIYLVRLEEQGGRYHVVEARVNRDPEQYSGGLAGHGLEGDARFLRYLIDNTLLGRRTPFSM